MMKKPGYKIVTLFAFGWLALLLVACSEPSLIAEPPATTLPPATVLPQPDPTVIAVSSIEIGTDSFPVDATEIIVTGGSTQFSENEIAQALFKLPLLRKADLRAYSLTPAKAQNLMTNFPNVEFVWDLTILDGDIVQYDAEAWTFDGDTDLDEVEYLIRCLPKLKAVKLNNGGGASIGLDDRLRILCSIYPDVTFTWDYSLFDRYFSTDAVTVNLDNVPMENTDELFAALPCFHALTRVEMDNTGLTNDQIGELFYAFPGVRFIWTIQLKYPRYRIRTDCRAYSTYVKPAEGFARLTSEDVQALKYCTDLMALDLGHNAISDISFMESLTKLQILILCDNRVTDISVLEFMPELEYAELMMNGITDVSVFQKLPKMLDLHLGSNKIRDFSPLYSCQQLKRLWVPSQFGEAFTSSRQKEIQAQLPDCFIFFNYGPHGSSPWQDDPRYAWMRAIFKAGTLRS